MFNEIFNIFFVTRLLSTAQGEQRVGLRQPVEPSDVQKKIANALIFCCGRRRRCTLRLDGPEKASKGPV